MNILGGRVLGVYMLMDRLALTFYLGVTRGALSCINNAQWPYV